MKRSVKRAASVLTLLCMVVTIGLSGCSKPVDLLDITPVIKAVDQLYSEAASVPVQYGAYEYILYMLNSNREAQAESATMQPSEDGGLVSVNSSDRFSKVYLSSQDVIYFDAEGGVSYGPEMSPIDFITATAKMYESGKGGITLLSDPVEDGVTVYKFIIPSIEVYEAIYAQRDAEMAKKMVESMKTLEDTYRVDENVQQVETDTTGTDGTGSDTSGEPGETATPETTAPTETPAADNNGEHTMSFELQVYVGETVPDFQAYMNYDISGDRYVGWYIGGCFPVADWTLSEDWYQPIDTFTAEEWTQKYNSLIDQINELITTSTNGIDLNIGISIAEYFAMDETERTNVMNRVDEAIQSSGYVYSEGKTVTDLKTAIETGFAAFTDDNSTDIMQAARVAGVANKVITDTKNDVVSGEAGDTINGEPNADADPESTDTAETPEPVDVSKMSTAAYINSNDREEIMRLAMDYWAGEGYTLGCTSADLVQLATDIGIRETAENLLELLTPAALEKGYIVQ